MSISVDLATAYAYASSFAANSKPAENKFGKDPIDLIDHSHLGTGRQFPPIETIRRMESLARQTSQRQP